MAILNVTSTVVEQTSAASSISGNYPAGSAGDLLVALVLDIGVGTTSQSTPTGWALGNNIGQNAVSTNRLRVYNKERGSDTDVTFNFTSSRTASLIILNIPGYKHQSSGSISGFSRFTFSGGSAPGTPAYIVVGTNASTPGTHFEVCWNDVSASTSAVTQEDAYQPDSGTQSWSEICRADATGQDLVQVMATEVLIENVDNYRVTNNSGTNFGRASFTIFDWPDQTRFVARLGQDGSVSQNGVNNRAYLQQHESTPWASLSFVNFRKVTLEAGVYDFAARAHWFSPLTIGSTRTLRLVVDGTVVNSESYTLNASVGTPQVNFRVNDFLIEEESEVWLEITQSGNSGDTTYDGAFYIEQVESLAPDPLPEPGPGYVKRLASSDLTLFAGSPTEINFGGTYYDGPALDARFFGTSEITKTWDGTQRRTPSGNRFYTLDKSEAWGYSEMRMIHPCDDLEAQAAWHKPQIGMLLQGSSGNTSSITAYNGVDDDLAPGDLMISFIGTRDNNTTDPSTASDWDYELTSIVSPFVNPYGFAFAASRYATADASDQLVWNFSENITAANYATFYISGGDYSVWHIGEDGFEAGPLGSTYTGASQVFEGDPTSQGMVAFVWSTHGAVFHGAHFSGRTGSGTGIGQLDMWYMDNATNDPREIYIEALAGNLIYLFFLGLVKTGDL